MSSQLRFYYLPDTERALLAELDSLGFAAWRFDGAHPELICQAASVAESSASQFAFTPSPAAIPSHTAGDFIQLSRPGPTALDARIWRDSASSEATPQAFEQLRRYFRRYATHDTDSGLWVVRSHFDAFRSVWRLQQQQLAELAQRNRDYAVTHLGAKQDAP